MHPVQPPDHADPAAPEASWVMGRSARWQTSEGRALLAQDPRLDDVRRLTLSGLALGTVPTLFVALRAIQRALYALDALWSRRE